MSDTVKNWTQWLKKSRFSYMNDEQVAQTFKWLFEVRDKVLERALLQDGDILIDVGTGTGLLAFGAYERLRSTGGFVIASDKFEDCVEDCKNFALNNGCGKDFGVLVSGADKIELSDSAVSVVVMRSVLVHILNKQACTDEFFRILKPGGRVSIFEPVIRSNTRYYELVNPENIRNYEAFKKAEAEFMSDENDSLTNFDQNTLKENFEKSGFSDIDLDIGTEASTYPVTQEMVEPWFNTPPSPGALTMKEKFLKYFNEEEVNNFIDDVKNDLGGRTITVKSFSAYIRAVKR